MKNVSGHLLPAKWTFTLVLSPLRLCSRYVMNSSTYTGYERSLLRVVENFRIIISVPGVKTSVVEALPTIGWVDPVRVGSCRTSFGEIVPVSRKFTMMKFHQSGQALRHRLSITITDSCPPCGKSLERNFPPAPNLFVSGCLLILVHAAGLFMALHVLWTRLSSWPLGNLDSNPTAPHPNFQPTYICTSEKLISLTWKFRKSQRDLGNSFEWI